MVLLRYSYTENKTSAKDFRIYRVQLQHPEHLNQALKVAALEELRQSPLGMNVSNAGGGWHGRPHLFQHERRLYHICIDVIREIEHRQVHPTCLQLEPYDIYCWANVSKNGSWNRLHTQEGSVGSGVYYADDGNSPLNHCGGRSVLKPTAHPKEDTYELTSLENERFLEHTSLPSTMDAKSCAYLEIHPVPGHMIIFPGWLQHCVLPLSQLDACSRRGSIAFNINDLLHD